MTLQEFFAQNPKVALGFSGGVDSAYLLYAAVQAGVDVTPYYIRTAFQPEFEQQDACKLAKQLGVRLKILRVDILADPQVTANPENRCYYCKRQLFGTLARQAAADGIPVLLDGTNASDDEGDRPGMRALQELSVRSPLRECGLTKAKIRQLSREAGLFTWDKPAYACLATRIPAGRKILPEDLRRVERAENAMHALGYKNFRVRLYHGAARIQLPQDQWQKAMNGSDKILQALAPDFEAVLFDLKGRG